MKLASLVRNLLPSRLGRAAVVALLMGTSVFVASPVMAQADPNAVSGGEMTIINGSDLKSWDPAITNDTYPGGPMDMLDAVYGGLVYVDVHGVVQGNMAQSLTSTDAVHWTLKLRPNVTFTDGTPFDAAAVKYNWDRVADPATTAPSQAFVSSWKDGIKIVDPMTIEVTLPQANRNFGSQIAQLAPFIASPTMLAAAKTKADIKPVGAGAFVLDNWNQGVSMTLKRNPKYWDQPRPYLDTLNFKIIPETNSRIATVVQGGATMMAGYTYQFGSNATAPGVATFEVAIPGLYRSYFNQKAGVFTDPRAREAFYEAMDRTRLMKAYTQVDGYVPPTNYFPSDSPYFDAKDSLPAYNPDHAQQLFDAMAKDGKPFKMTLVTYSNSDLKRLASYIQQTLGAYQNTDVQLNIIDQAMLQQTCQTNMAFDFCLDGGVMVANGAEPLISNLLSSGGRFNWGQYNNPKMDAALAAANATVDPGKVKAQYDIVQQLVAQDMPLYLFGTEPRHLLVRDNTGGIVPSDGGMLQKQFLFVCKDACLAKK